MATENDEAAALANLRANPSDPNALAEFAKIAARRGKLDAALSSIDRALALAPGRCELFTQRGHILHDRGDWFAARESYKQAFINGETDPVAHEGAAYVATRLGDAQRAAYHRDRAFADRSRTFAAYRGIGDAPHILLLVSALGGNIDTQNYLTSDQFAITKFVAEYDDFSIVPDHDGIFNAIGDADRAALALERVCARFAAHNRPVINPPAAVQATTRLHNAQRLSALPGIRMPKAAQLSRSVLETDAALRAALHDAQVGFPLLVRALGFHTGEHFARVWSAAELRAVAQDFPGDELLVLEYCDLTDGDGFTRKYRVMAIGGKLYAAHMAAARAWKVHYFRSEMAENQALRDEEATFLADPAAHLGPTIWAALERVAEQLQLDYAGIDFGLDANGHAVVFEANATMIVPTIAADSRWDYKREAPERIHAAVAALLRAEFKPHRRTPNPEDV